MEYCNGGDLEHYKTKLGGKNKQTNSLMLAEAQYALQQIIAGFISYR